MSSAMGYFQGRAVTCQGDVTSAARTAFERVLAHKLTGEKQKISGRLIRLLAEVSRHFAYKPLTVVSGFRPYNRHQFTPKSKHNLGHAIDFRVEGIANEVLRDFCRTLPDVGVGYYPNSTFVHLDVREDRGYWIDVSGPGAHPHYTSAAQLERARRHQRTQHQHIEAASDALQVEHPRPRQTHQRRAR